MCGILAIFDPNGRQTSDEKSIKTLCDLMAHRGPNHCGVYGDAWVKLGHRRLSILDLNERSNQPMRKGELIIVHNGEVYNYREIRKELEKERGVEFLTESDTEVILEAFRAYGADCVKRFNGMFAFIIWDKEKKEIFVARDRLGVKPLYYTCRDGVYYFASDIKVLWAYLPLNENLSSQSITSFFVQGYISIPESTTRGLHHFPPAHTAIVNDQGMRRGCYWDLNAAKKSHLKFPEAVETTESLLRDAIKLRLRSDVPLGCFLSGGVDSSLITALAAGELGHSFHTYSIGFDDKDADESVYSQRVSKRYQTQHHHTHLDKTCLENLPEIVWYYSDLFGDASAVPTYFVSKEAKRELTVVLTGDGADEAFGGYVDPFAVYLNQGYRYVPSFLKNLGSWLLPKHPIYPLRWLKRFQDIAHLPPEKIYAQLKSGSWSPYSNAFCENGFDLEENIAHYFNLCRRHNPVDRFLYTDIVDRLTHDFLVKVDMASMAHSLEARSPFLDYRLIELGYSLDHNVRYAHLRRKAVLKKILEKYVERDIIYRKKMGFSIPMETWLSDKKILAIISKVMSRSSTLTRFIDKDVVKQIVGEFARGQMAHANRVWLLLWYQIWDGLFVSRVYQSQQKLSEL